jgi:single-stranded-DNA-specific exonuclease
MHKQWHILEDPPQSFFDAFPTISPVVLKLLYHRDIRTQEAMDEFLNPDYGQDIHDPYLFVDMDKAVDRIFQAIEKNESITIYGDYDADGVSASTILSDTIHAIGGEHTVYLPHRDTEGYGLNSQAVETLAHEHTKVLITCDCGISNTEEVAKAHELGIDVIITDHHHVPDVLPEAYAIIHPRLERETYPGKWLAGAGVAFKLCQAMLQRHKESGKELTTGDTHDGFEKWLLDMVAIATVADMVPLLGESRTLTKYGLIVLQKTRRIGLIKMYKEAGIMHEDGSWKREINAGTIGYQIAPRINAAGRIAHSNVAYELMTTKDPIKATDMAYQLEVNNTDRKKLVETMMEVAESEIAMQKDNPVYVVWQEGWRTGVVGLVAGKLKEKYGKPVFAIAINGDEITGSGRSIDGFHITEALTSMSHLFVKFGGHPMAAGFSLNGVEAFESFKTKVLEIYTEQTKGKELIPTINIDAEVKLDDIDWNLYDLLGQFEPFGKDNEQPLYAAMGIEVVSAKSMGKDGQHITIMAKQDGGNTRKFVGWNYCHKDNEHNWCTILSPGDIIDVIFDIGVNEWNGNRTLQLTIKDIKQSES